ncbi:MAG: MarR family transcriptional regulator [Saprospiraceae bacterium]|nr:MarR family transcriptional regulator [Saprospiraceae bacterium]MDZ4705335.1 MarR family transcriptional regulator [Saprospiraceae bacterium]
MKIEAAIRQVKPLQPLQKVIINLIYTYHWHMERSAMVFKPFDLTSQQFNVLRILRGRHPESIPVGEVKCVMLDKNPDLTRLGDRLIQKGLIQRELNAQNRREVLMQITKAGMELLDQVEVGMEKSKSQWQNLTDEEAEQLSDLLDKLRG